MVDTVMLDLQLCAPRSSLKDNEDKERWQETIETTKALNGLYKLKDDWIVTDAFVCT